MRYGTDIRPLFTDGWPDGWRERWRLVREFVDRWAGTELPDVGGRAKEVSEAETRLRRALPPSVREWLAFAYDVGLHGEKPTLHDRIWLSDPVGGQDVLTVLVEAGGYVWAVPLRNPAADDPEVNGYYGYFDFPTAELHIRGSDANRRCGSLTEFALERVLLGWSGHRSGRRGLLGAVPDPDGMRHRLAGAFPVRVRVGAIEVFERGGLIVMLISRQAGVYIAVRQTVGVSDDAVPPFVSAALRMGQRLIQARHNAEDDIPF